MKRVWNRYTKWLTILACSAAAFMLLVAVGLFILNTFMFRGHFPKPMPFESSTWKSNPETHKMNSIRIRMVDDLLKSHPLIGLTRTEVESLLGPADKTTYFHEFDMVYMLGPERGIPIDSEWLIIKLDPSGRVSQAVLARD